MKSAAIYMTILLWTILPVDDISAQTQLEQDRVWFSPNTASVDMLEMFTAPEKWDLAREKIDVFKFSTSQVGSGGWGCQLNPAQICGENYLDNLVDVDAFSILGHWGIGIGIESFFAGPVVNADPIECSTAQSVFNLSLNGAINVIQNVEANGGIVRYLAMDEPIRQWLPAYYYIYTGQTDPRPCLVDSLEIIADHVAAYILQMESWFPEIPIGHIELYPEVSVGQLKDWVIALEDRGVSLPFLHLDVNGPRVDQYNSWGIVTDIASDFAELKSFLEDRGIAFGVIITDIQWNSQLWEPDAYDDQTYYEGAIDWSESVNATGVELDHVVIQSWVHPYYTTGPGPKEVPVNLPEDDPAVYSHTRLVNDALAVITAAEAEDADEGPGRFMLYQNVPNPFNPSTTIRFDLPGATYVRLCVYNVKGELVSTIVDRQMTEGRKEINWTATGSGGQPVSSGIYFYRLVAGDFTQTRKIVLLR
ncbi:MAG: T9SS type A sorting domain-containing protein [Bacteroidales bacterium]|nr:T9SS type A sorting domain-containing protein [Candidatus Latescibacterota bacterium]